MGKLRNLQVFVDTQLISAWESLIPGCWRAEGPSQIQTTDETPRAPSAQALEIFGALGRTRTCAPGSGGRRSIH